MSLFKQRVKIKMKNNKIYKNNKLIMIKINSKKLIN